MIIQIKYLLGGLKIGLFILSSLSMISCSEIFNRDCRVTGDYKKYDCSAGYENIVDFRDVEVDCINNDSCGLLIENKGTAVIINDIESYNKCQDTSYYNSIYQPDSSFWDFNSHTLVGFCVNTDEGIKVYSKVFVCINKEKKEILIRCQYEISDQCAGSQISHRRVSYWISLPKVSAEYTYSFSIVNVNPL